MDRPRDERQGEPRRSAVPRARISLVCEVRQGPRPWRAARLENLSPDGFKLTWLPEARLDLPLRIRIPGMQLLTARICWIEDQAAGCAFDEPIHPVVFEHIVETARRG
jgi:hypothetical protein